MDSLSPDPAKRKVSDGSRSKKSEQLGMDYGTASNRLRKRILFHMLQRLGENTCFKCGELIETSDHLSVEHKLPWLDHSSDLFWDIHNIAFSHLACNRPHNLTSGTAKRRKIAPEGTSWCARCKQFVDLEKFASHVGKWDGLQSVCKDCFNGRRNTKRKINPHYGR